MGLNCAYTDVLQRSMVTIFSLPYYFLNSISFFYLTLRIQYVIHITYTICVSQLFILSVRLLMNSSRFLVVKFLENPELYTDFRLGRWSLPLTSTLFKGQLYFPKIQQACFNSSVLIQFLITKQCYIYYLLWLRTGNSMEDLI